MPLDLMGNVSLSLQIVILFLLVLGVPFVKGAGVKKNFMVHGYFTILALILHSILIFLVMVPSFNDGFSEISSLPVLSFITVTSHATLGSLAEILGIVVVAFWLSKPLTEMNCLKAKKLMLPLLIIWAISIINGALIHILQLM